MKKTIFLLPLLGILLFSCQRKADKDYDIIVYGGTSAGVIAAYSAKLEGKKVLLIEPGKHLGGLSSGGLGQTDIGNKYAVTGLARNFYRRLGDHYGKLEAWKFEPHVAEEIFNQYITEADVDVLYDFRLTDVVMKKNKIESVTLENSSLPNTSTNRSISASYYIDCSYEGDLMAGAGVSYTVGRESTIPMEKHIMAFSSGRTISSLTASTRISNRVILQAASAGVYRPWVSRLWGWHHADQADTLSRHTITGFA